ncbi:hypothetical protein WT08_00235 [Burkholderia sp. MSMB1552]|nr:hypothetical protein WT08_00235 [Burkholderia sp. MSMB1552]KWZ50477.1 hypothetical protein WS92_24105 [Burkholderia sp. MSMB1588]
MTKSATPLGTEAMPVSNAGIVLLWPFLPGWLGRLGLLHTVEDKPGFIDEQAQMQAVRWLDNLVWGGDINEIAEWRMLLNKLLCGMSLDAALPESSWRASEAIVVALRDQCLASLPAQLPGLQRCGAGDIRSMFLQRPGQLQWRSDQLGTEPHWQLNVEQDASDILLRELPWPLEQVIFPWLEQPLSINWL